MVMKILTVVILLAMASDSTGQASISWIQNTPGVSVALDNSNNVFTVRSSNVAGGDITLSKRNSNGTLIWERSYDQTDPNKFDKAAWVDTDHLGNAIIAGNLTSFGSATATGNGLVMKFDPSGSLLWRIVFTSSSDAMLLSKCISDANGNIYLLGRFANNLASLNTQVRKLDQNGTTVWTYTSMTIGLPVNMKLTPDNSILLVGRSGNTGPNGYAKVSSSGSLIWSMNVSNTSAAGDAAGEANGNTYLVNREITAIAPGSTIRKLDNSGVQIWQRPVNLLASRIETGGDNLPVTAGLPAMSSTGTALAKHDGAGVQLWLNSDADGSNNITQHIQLGIDANNNAYIGGNMTTGTVAGMAVCKVSSGGASAWSLPVQGTGMAGLEIGSDNAVYLTGSITAKIRQSLQCPAPQNLQTSDITSTTARLGWDHVPGAIRYEIFYRSMISPSVNRLWERRSVPGNTNSLTLSGLKCNMFYEWKMMTVCDSLSPVINTGFSTTVTFRTSPCTSVSDIFEGNSKEITADEPPPSPSAPESIFLSDNYPNPFNPTTTIEFGISEDAHVSIIVFNSLGQKVSTLVDGFRSKGNYSATWNGTDENGKALSGGIYFYKMTAGSFVEVRKMVLAK